MNDPTAGLPLSAPEALTVLGALVLVAARWLPERLRGPAALAAGALLAGSVTVLVMTGLRWQLVPVVVAAAVVGAFLLAPVVARRSGRTPWRARWWLAVPGSVVCAALIAAGPVSVWAFPVPNFPAPSGDFPVGTEALEWSSRPAGGRPGRGAAHARGAALVPGGPERSGRPAGAVPRTYGGGGAYGLLGVGGLRRGTRISARLPAARPEPRGAGRAGGGRRRALPCGGVLARARRCAHPEHRLGGGTGLPRLCRGGRRPSVRLRRRGPVGRADPPYPGLGHRRPGEGPGGGGGVDPDARR